MSVARASLSFIVSYLSRAPYVRLLLLVAVGGFLWLSRMGVEVIALTLQPWMLTALKLIALYLALSLGFDIARRVITFAYRAHHNYPDEHTDLFILGMRRITFALVHLVFALVLVHALFGGLLQVLTSLALVSVFLGIVFKEPISNFLMGASVMLSGNFQLREYVKFGQYKGRITDITFQYVKLITDTNDIVFVPNHLMATQESVNFSRSKTKNVFVPFSLSRASFACHAPIVKRIRHEIPHELPDIIASDEQITISYDAVGHDRADWSVEYVVPAYSFKIEKKLRNLTLDIVLQEIERARMAEAQTRET